MNSIDITNVVAQHLSHHADATAQTMHELAGNLQVKIPAKLNPADSQG